VNRAASTHIKRAVTYYGKGESFYRKAAVEIEKALEADRTLTQREIAEAFDRKPNWVAAILRWHRSGASTPTPWKGERPTSDLNRMATRKVLRESSRDEVAALLASLSEANVTKLAQAILASPGGQAAITRALTADETRRARRRRPKGQSFQGPKRRLLVFAVVREMLLDSEFVAKEIAAMGLSDDDRTELLALVDGIASHVDAVKAELRRERRGDGKLVAIRGGKQS